MEEILKEYKSGILAGISSLFFFAFLIGMYHDGGNIKNAIIDFFFGICG